MKISNTDLLHIGVISLFPEMFKALEQGMTGRALTQQQLQLSLVNLRDYATDKHRCVDDRPFGGGPGMVLKTGPIRSAINDMQQKLGPNTLKVYLSPQGQVVDQAKLIRFLETSRPLLLLAGRYEGVDERVITNDIDEEWSIGDVVLSGGELAAMMIIDAMTRLLPGVLGCEESAEQDSFMNNLLDHPHYTRPAVTPEGEAIPKILASGDHKAIAEWRLKLALGKTHEKRPDLIAKYPISETEQKLLNEYLNEKLRSQTDV